MTSQIINTFAESEEALALQRPAVLNLSPLHTVKIDGITKRLPVNPLFQAEMPITLYLVDEGIALTAQLTDQLYVGRLDFDFEPADKLGIDLMEYGARERGVSRRHAKFCWISSQPAIVDLKSTNGTYINGIRLTPGVPGFLQDGDEICFGKMLCHIHFGLGSAAL
jgi:hypothetical protein